MTFDNIEKAVRKATEALHEKGYAQAYVTFGGRWDGECFGWSSLVYLFGMPKDRPFVSMNADPNIVSAELLQHCADAPDLDLDGTYLDATLGMDLLKAQVA